MFLLLRFLSYAVFVGLPAALLLAGWTHRKTSPVRSRGALLLAVAVATVGGWAFGVEPGWLEVTRYEIRSPKLTRAVRLAVVADLQTDEVGEHERRALRAAMAESPDLILLTGDYLQLRPQAWAREAQSLRTELARLQAPLGVWAVGGNVDPAGWPSLFEGLSIRALSESTTLQAGELALSALSLADSFSGRYPVGETSSFHIAFGHAPDFALAHPPVDLLIAGHTHGGQVRLPGLGPLLTLSRVPRSWAAGRTDFADGRTLIVSRGIGMERGAAPRLRFLCRPEVVVIDLVPEPAA